MGFPRQEYWSGLPFPSLFLCIITWIKVKLSIPMHLMLALNLKICFVLESTERSWSLMQRQAPQIKAIWFLLLYLYCFNYSYFTQETTMVQNIINCDCVTVILDRTIQNQLVRPSGPGLLLFGRFLSSASISVLVIGLFIISISSGFSLGRLNFSKNLSISPRLSILLP